MAEPFFDLGDWTRPKSVDDAEPSPSRQSIAAVCRNVARGLRTMPVGQDWTEADRDAAMATLERLADRFDGQRGFGI